jgi:hypothetical protein
LKNAKPLKKRARKNQNLFVCNSHNHLRIPKSEFRSQNLGARKTLRKRIFPVSVSVFKNFAL